MPQRYFLWFFLLALAGHVAAAQAATVVIANRTPESITFLVTDKQASSQKHSVAARDVVSLRGEPGLKLTFRTGGKLRHYVLDPNAVYYFGEDPARGLDLHRIGFAGDQTSQQTVSVTASQKDESRAAPPQGSDKRAVVTIPVKLLVDEEEPARREIWEKRLRGRIAEASKITERHCFVRFEVVAVETWESDNAIADFNRSLMEFEQEVQPAPGRLAIGFTSQYQLPHGRTHLGGTRGMLHTHLLVREWSQHINEPERLEILLHELGHFLGSVHSPEHDSVMRALLGDRQARARSFRIGFDPVNTLAMCLVSEELLARPQARVADLSLATQVELRKIYNDIARALPDDPTAGNYLSLLQKVQVGPLIRGARLVVQGVVRVAEHNARAPAEADLERLIPARISGDPLADLYLRQAAATARQLPADIAARAYLLGLAIALDRSDLLRENSVLGPVCRLIETDQERAARLSVLGNPTARTREDLLAHFSLSAGLTSVVGPLATEALGIAKECRDASGTSGFSFVDFQADLAGVAFAKHILKTPQAIGAIAEKGSLSDHLPEQGDLREGLSWDTFTHDYGSTTDPRFLEVRSAIKQRIEALPGHRKSAD